MPHDLHARFPCVPQTPLVWALLSELPNSFFTELLRPNKATGISLCWKKRPGGAEMRLGTSSVDAACGFYVFTPYFPPVSLVTLHVTLWYHSQGLGSGKLSGSWGSVEAEGDHSSRKSCAKIFLSLFAIQYKCIQDFRRFKGILSAKQLTCLAWNRVPVCPKVSDHAWQVINVMIHKVQWTGGWGTSEEGNPAW